ncbi:PEP-CTERM domain protein [Teredinibacter turnerae]|uniref:PEP-CTERM domain protein n=1 Tax=Teredinibacter turnerae TaxID=2426 RepID=UPI00036D4048|nr:PEP-CTERM domain protein [Teredinibacter turnerae]
MKKMHVIQLVSTLLLAAHLTSANAITIDILPTEQTVLLGDQVGVDIWVSDLGDNFALGDFDFDLTFDSSIISFDSVSFGSGLGDSWQDYSATDGLLNLNELSWETAGSLLTNQPMNFSLATILFNTEAIGSTQVSFSTVWALGDQWGNPFDFTTSDGTINVIGGVNPVPLPGSLPLMLSGLIAAGFVRYKKQLLSRFK